jgi:hypothetical protein
VLISVGHIDCRVTQIVGGTNPQVISQQQQQTIENNQILKQLYHGRTAIMGLGVHIPCESNSNQGPGQVLLVIISHST